MGKVPSVVHTQTFIKKIFSKPTTDTRWVGCQKGIPMEDQYTITVKKSFVTQCDERAQLYKANGRSQERLRRDIEAEIFEWHMIDKKLAEDHESWKVDMILPTLGKVDVKLISKYYNIGCKKLLHIKQQEGEVDNYVFIEYIKRPDRILKSRDKVTVRVIGHLSYDDLWKNIKVSRFNGYYVDVHGLFRKRV